MATINKLIILPLFRGSAKQKKKKKKKGRVVFEYGLWHSWRNSVWSASCHCAFRQVIPVLTGCWEELRRMPVHMWCNTESVQVVWHVLFFCLGWAGIKLELSTMTLPLKILKSMASLATFLWCCREGHSSLLIISSTLGVVVLADDKWSCLSLDSMYPVDVPFGVWIPHCADIFWCGSDEGLVRYHF